MPDLAGQLRAYLDETTPAGSVTDHAFGLGHAEAADPPSATSTATTQVRLLVVALFVLVAAAAALLSTLLGGEQGTDLTTRAEPIGADADSSSPPEGPPEPPATEEPEAAPRPSGIRGTRLQWDLGAVPVDGHPSPQLLSDGKNLYWVGNRLHTSSDGRTWVATDFGSDPPTLFGSTGVDQGWAGQLVLTAETENGVRVEIVGIDGSVRTTSLAPEPPDDPTTIRWLAEPRGSIGPRGAIVIARQRTLDLGPVIGVAVPGGESSVTSIRLDEPEGTIVVVEHPGGSERVLLEDLGITDIHELETGARTVGWHSPDGLSWEPIPSTALFGPSEPGSFAATATATGFVVVEGNGATWTSPDGMEWSATVAPTSPVGGAALLPWQAGAVVFDSARGLMAVEDREVQGLLEAADPPSTFQNAHASGQAGIAYLVDVDRDVPTFDLVYSPDAVRWHRQSPPPTEGSLYCCYLDTWAVTVGSENVYVLADSDAGLELWVGTPRNEEER